MVLSLLDESSLKTMIRIDNKKQLYTLYTIHIINRGVGGGGGGGKGEAGTGLEAKRLRTAGIIMVQNTIQNVNSHTSN